MTPRSTSWLAVGLLLAACGGPVAPWTTAPATGLDLRLEVAPKEVALLQPVTATLDLFVREGLDVGFTPQVESADFVVTTHAEPPVPLRQPPEPLRPARTGWRRRVGTRRP